MNTVEYITSPVGWVKVGDASPELQTEAELLEVLRGLVAQSEQRIVALVEQHHARNPPPGDE